MAGVDLDSFTWLLTDAGQRLLERATHAWADAAGDPVRAAAAVRRIEPDADRAAAALTQVQLRARAVAKFGDDALRMYFTPDGARAGHPARVAATGPPGCAAAQPSASSTSAAASAATWSRSPGPG